MTFFIENPLVQSEEEQTPENLEFWLVFNKIDLMDKAEAEAEDDEDWDELGEEEDKELVYYNSQKEEQEK
ncbi:hypothetical protein CE183_29025 [Klebsiella pneumoniae]|nr:hypothetical protein CE183_29025 [Klebsiella pneumoniae]